MISEPIPTNLKERIAALQQRNVSPPSQRAPSPASTTTLNAPPPGSVAALRDKIARFEKKGGVPVPRGSFGLGAPPSENGQPKRYGELYGNRIPSQVTGGSIRLASHTTGGAFPPSAMANTSNSLNNRRFSMSQVEMEGNFDDMLHSTKVTADMSTAEEDTGAKADEAEPPIGHRPQRSVTSSDTLYRSSTERPASTIMASTLVQEPAQEAPSFVEAPMESPQSIVEPEDTPEVDEKPLEVADTEANQTTATDDLPEPEPLHSIPDAKVEAQIAQITDDASRHSSPDPAPIVETTQPESVAPSLPTDEPPYIAPLLPHIANSPSRLDEVAPSLPALGRLSMAIVSEPATTEPPAAPPVVESPVEAPRPDESSKPSAKEPAAESSKPQPRASIAQEPDFDPFSYVAHDPTRPSFSTTVHRKVVESTPRSSTVIRVIPRPTEAPKPLDSVEIPGTHGIGDLSTLMQDAVTWEALLDGVTLPESAPAEKSAEPETEEKEQSEAVKKRADDARVRKQSIRRKRSHGSAKKKVSATTPEPPVPIPLPPIEPFVIPPPEPGPKRSIAKDLVPDDTKLISPPPSSFIPPDHRKFAPTHDVSRSPNTLSPNPPAKSPSKYRYFASLRRLSGFGSSNSRPSTVNRASAMKQRSVSSMEDSPIVITPSDDVEFGAVKQPRESQDRRPSSMYNVRWPNKNKNGSGIFRPGSFVDKIFQRTRTRSNASSRVSKLTSPSAHSLADPSLIPPMPTLDPVGADSTDSYRPRAPKRSSSVSSSLSPNTLSPPTLSSPAKNRPPPSSFAPPPQLPPIPSWADTPTNDFQNVSTTTTTTNAPLLDLEFFSTFPTTMDQQPEPTTTR